MARHGLIGSAVLGAAMSFARPARAELELRWSAPVNCPQRDEVFERIGRVAGAALEETVGLSVEGTIEPADGRYRLTLLVRSGEDVRERVIASDSCADLAGAAAVTVALLLGVDPSTIDTGKTGPGAGGVEDGGAAKKPPPDARDKPKQNDTPPGKPQPGEEPEQSAPWGVLLRAPVVALDFGPLPRPAFGAGLGAGARYGAWRALLTGRVSLRQTVSAPNSGGAFGAELERWTVDLAICHGWRSGQFELAPCVETALEHLNAKGFGESLSPSEERTMWVAVGAGGAAHWYALESIALFASVTGYVELSRPRLVISGLGEVAQLSPLAAGATFGVEWIL